MRAAHGPWTSTSGGCARSCRLLVESLVTVKQFGYKLTYDKIWGAFTQ